MGAHLRRGWGYRANIATRAVAGSLGAYLVAACVAAAAARTLPLPRLDAIVPATMLAFVVAPGVTIWAFLAPGPVRALVGVLGAAALLAGIAWFAGMPAA
ncbi:ketohydroxyglutarate aldolase [uncultured Sphingomonas sp.]|uniref:ketohydroxyglutarate aldolase n=1 Tax=uncultured Sphingomonas sp. TaxID=158754 RepID=UPI0025F5BB97|nr:ketohydroxyglutarate aldolase [uncultured Sphingomonas sp.]